MSSAGVIRFGVCVALAAVWWIFFAPLIDSLAILEPMGEVVSQQRLDTQSILILGFKVSPVLLLLAIGLQLWAQALRRTQGYTSGGIGIRMITGIYVVQIALIVLCICLGPVVDALLFQMMQLPGIPDTTIPFDILYLGMSWFYPLLVIIMVACYVGLFISIARELDYEVRGALTSRKKSNFF